MKPVFQLFLVVMLVFFTSCRDTKKEEVKEESIAVEKIDVEDDELTNEIEKEKQELKKNLDELDKI